MKKKVIVIVLGSLVGLGALWGVNRQFGLVGLMQKVNIVKGVFPWEDVVPCINEKAEVSRMSIDRISWRKARKILRHAGKILGLLLPCPHGPAGEPAAPGAVWPL